MKKSFYTRILSVAALAARITSQAGVYSNGLGPLPHQPNEICLWSYSYGTNFYTEWYVSTNTLAQQPRWDGFLTEVPVSIRQACSLALKQSAKEHPDVKSWAVNSISLQHPPSLSGAGWQNNIWFYSVTLNPLDTKFQEQIEGINTTFPQFSSMQIVLLDGTVVPGRTIHGK